MGGAAVAGAAVALRQRHWGKACAGAVLPDEFFRPLGSGGCARAPLDMEALAYPPEPNGLINSSSNTAPEGGTLVYQTVSQAFLKWRCHVLRCAASEPLERSLGTA